MKKLKIAVALLLVIGIISGLKPGRSLASTGSIYLSPASSSVQIDKDVTLALRITPGTSVNAVQATINYSQSDLSFVSTSLSAFPVCTVNSGGGGTVSLACAILAGSVSSDSLVANITFEALAGSGNTTPSITDANAAYNGTWTDPGSTNATISFTSPAAPSSPVKTVKSTPKTESSSDSSATSSSAATPIQLTVVSPPTAIIIKPSLKTVQYTTAEVAVSTNLATKTTIDYGTDKTDLNNSTSLGSSAATATPNLITSLMPGTTYYYKVVAQAADGTTTESSIQSFTTKGYTISVTVLGSNDRPLANQLVTLHSIAMTAKTNAQGVATFTNVTPGLHHVEYTAAGHTFTQQVYVASNVSTENSQQTAAPQTAAVILSGYHAPSVTYLGYAAISLLGLVVVLLLAKLAPHFRLISKNGQPLQVHLPQHHKTSAS